MKAPKMNEVRMLDKNDYLSFNLAKLLKIKGVNVYSECGRNATSYDKKGVLRRYKGQGPYPTVTYDNFVEWLGDNLGIYITCEDDVGGIGDVIISVKDINGKDIKPSELHLCPSLGFELTIRSLLHLIN